MSATLPQKSQDRNRRKTRKRNSRKTRERNRRLLNQRKRRILDRIVNRVVNIENETAKAYSGNYSDFETQRAIQLAQHQTMYERQQREIAHMMSFVERFRAQATKARQAQSRNSQSSASHRT